MVAGEGEGSRAHGRPALTDSDNMATADLTAAALTAAALTAAALSADSSTRLAGAGGRGQGGYSAQRHTLAHGETFGKQAQVRGVRPVRAVRVRGFSHCCTRRRGRQGLLLKSKDVAYRAASRTVPSLPTHASGARALELCACRPAGVGDASRVLLLPPRLMPAAGAGRAGVRAPQAGPGHPAQGRGGVAAAL